MFFPIRFLGIIFFLICVSGFAFAADNSSSIKGTWAGDPNCSQKPIEVWLSIGTTLLYQVEVPAHGSFEFYTIPGHFHLVGTNPDSCFAEADIDLKMGESKAIELSLAPIKKRAPAGANP